MSRIVVLDTETTGLDPQKGDLIQIAIIALDEFFRPDKRVPPFYMLIRPKKYRPGSDYEAEIAPALTVNKLKLKDLLEKGIDPIKASELFDEWWQRLGEQLLEPLAQNYPFDKAFLQDWLGHESFNQFFSRYYRDTYACANFLTDQAKYAGSQLPFPLGFSLSKLAKALGFENPRAHDAFTDCLTTAEVYRRSLNYIHVPLKVTKQDYEVK